MMGRFKLNAALQRLWESGGVMRFVYWLIGVLGVVAASSTSLKAQPKLSDLGCSVWLQVREEPLTRKVHAELRDAAISAAAALGARNNLTDAQLLSLVDERCDRNRNMSVQNAILDIVRLASEAKEPPSSTSGVVEARVSEGSGIGVGPLLVVVVLVVVGVLAVVGDAASNGRGGQPKRQARTTESPAWNVKVRISLVVLVVVLPLYFMATDADDRRFFLMNGARYGAPLILGGLVGLVASFILWRKDIAGKITIAVALCGFVIAAVGGAYAEMARWNETAIFVFWSSLVAWAMVGWALWNVVVAVFTLLPSKASGLPVREAEIDKEPKA